jgi:hypothetical protein
MKGCGAMGVRGTGRMRILACSLGMKGQISVGLGSVLVRNSKQMSLSIVYFRLRSDNIYKYALPSQRRKIPSTIVN